MNDVNKDPVEAENILIILLDVVLYLTLIINYCTLLQYCKDLIKNKSTVLITLQYNHRKFFYRT